MAVTPRSVKAKNKRASSAKKSPKLSKSSRPTKQSSALSKRRAKSLTLAKPGDAQKTKPASIDKKKKRRVYTEAELNIPKLNGIVPIGVQKSKGQKKGKKFVDDQESMMAILNVVKADKEGHIESKVQKARQLEEIRTAKKAEHEAKAKERSELHKTKDALRKKRKRKHLGADADDDTAVTSTNRTGGVSDGKLPQKPKKRVSFV